MTSLRENPPAARLLGRRILEADAATGTTRVRFEARPEFFNRRGSIQGGILAAMLDSTLGCTLVPSLKRGESIVTLEMKVSFLRAAGIGEIFGIGRVVERGGAIAFVEGELRDAEDSRLATATATFRIQRRREDASRG
jgi:uncharacterized protein (TIGR00369 family)